jgi:alkanesulfonate monooxygenase SsuD/methylene tetrahydromethanopterin reductase-like flavin-dependent oxidoreductase (luciferase family)
MHFGQFNLLGYRTRGIAAATLYDHAVDQVRAAEAAGFEIAWFAEHHFSNYCVIPSPLMMVARLAGETSRIKLGSGVVVAPLYNPVRLLSEIGMADALSHGRLVLGVGSGYQPYEFERFGEDLADSVDKTLEFLAMLERAFATETFSFEGAHYRVPPTHIAPRPVRGLPDVWIAGDNPRLQGHAARKGYPVMVTPRHATVAQLVEARRRLTTVAAEAGAAGERVALAPLRHLCITDRRAEAESFVDSVRHQIRLSQSLRHREEILDGAMLIETPYPGEPPVETLAAHLLVGDAETVAERLTAIIDAVEPCHVLLQCQAGASDPTLALRSIERFASTVRPMVEKALGPLERIGQSGGEGPA